jgi:hypothetical protein
MAFTGHAGCVGVPGQAGAIDSLTDEQRATFAPYVAGWVREAFTGGEFDQEHRRVIVDGLRRCYAAADLRWPRRAVFVASPRVGEVVAVVSAAAVVARREAASRRAWPVWRHRRRRAGMWLHAAVQWVWSMLLAILVVTVCVWLVGGYLLASTLDVLSAAGFGLMILGTAAGIAVGAAAGRHLWREIQETDERAEQARLIRAATAEINATGARIRAATVGVGTADLAAAVTPAVVDAVRAGVQQPVADAVNPIGKIILELSGLTIGMHAVLRRASRAVDFAVGTDPSLVPAWNLCQSGPPPGTGPVQAQHADEVVAALCWWRRYGDPAFGGERWAGLQAYADAGRLWWWPHPDFVIVSKPPGELHVERASSGAYQIHRADGPAVRWHDEAEFHFWRGLRVPGDLAAGDWTVQQIHEEANSELRRAAIERMGWLTYIDKAGLRLVARAPDPGNAPHDLLLYDDPEHRLGFARLLVMTNGSPDRSGALRRYAEAVPGHFHDPVAAAAWQYDCPVETYRQLNRRT